MLSKVTIYLRDSNTVANFYNNRRLLSPSSSSSSQSYHRQNNKLIAFFIVTVVVTALLIVFMSAHSSSSSPAARLVAFNLKYWPSAMQSWLTNNNANNNADKLITEASSNSEDINEINGNDEALIYDAITVENETSQSANTNTTTNHLLNSHSSSDGGFSCDDLHCFPLIKLSSNFTNGKIHSDLIDFRRVLLLVQYNRPNYRSVTPKLEYLYGQGVFAGVMHCGPDMSEKRLPKQYRHLLNVTFLEISSTFASFASSKTTNNLNSSAATNPQDKINLHCLPLAIGAYEKQLKSPEAKIENSIDGILAITDNLIPNLWLFSKTRYRLNDVWIQNPSNNEVVDIESRRRYRIGHHVEHQVSNASVSIKPPAVATTLDLLSLFNLWPRLEAFYADLEQKSQKTRHPDRIFWGEFYYNLIAQTGGRSRVIEGSADVYYVPSRQLQSVRQILLLFSEYNIPREYAVISTLRSLIANYSLSINPNNKNNNNDTHLQYLSDGGGGSGRTGGHDGGAGFLSAISAVSENDNSSVAADYWYYSTNFYHRHPPLINYQFELSKLDDKIADDSSPSSNKKRDSLLAKRCQYCFKQKMFSIYGQLQSALFQ